MEETTHLDPFTIQQKQNLELDEIYKKQQAAMAQQLEAANQYTRMECIKQAVEIWKILYSDKINQTKDHSGKVLSIARDLEDYVVNGSK